MKLSDFAIAKPGVIVEVQDTPIAAKLMEYGILPGADFIIINRAAFNGPLMLRVGSLRVVLRASEADAIVVNNL